MKKNILLSSLALVSLNLAAQQVLTLNSDLDGEGRKIDNWHLWQARGVRGTAAASGGIVKLIKVRQGSMFQEVSSIKPGEKYVFTVKARANGDNVTPTASIQLVDANDKIINKSAKNGVFGDADADGWRTAEIAFTTPNDQSFALVRVLFGSKGPAEGLTDDDYCEFDKAQLISTAPAAAPAAAPAKAVLNKNSDLDGSGRKVPEWQMWRARGTRCWVSASNGTVRLVHAAQSSMHQDVAGLQPGKTYSFTVKARVKGDQVKPTVSVYMVDANDKILNKTVKRGSFGAPDADGWQLGEVVFTAPENVDFALTRILFGSAGKGEIPDDNWCEFDTAELREK